MKATIFAAFGGAAVVTLWVFLFGHESTVLAQRPYAVEAGSELIALPATIDSGHQQISIIDPAKRVLAVYHVELGSGAITLKSVRNIYGDLQIDEFNGVSPLPRDVRAQLEHR
jgi:hypothetical protein